MHQHDLAYTATIYTPARSPQNAVEPPVNGNSYITALSTESGAQASDTVGNTPGVATEYSRIGPSYENIANSGSHRCSLGEIESLIVSQRGMSFQSHTQPLAEGMVAVVLGNVKQLQWNMRFHSKVENTRNIHICNIERKC